MYASSNTTHINSALLQKHEGIAHFWGTMQFSFNGFIEKAPGQTQSETTIVIPRQTHGSTVGKVTEDNFSQPFECTDALITNVQGICIAVKTADCVPILLFDPVQKAIAAIHSGWRSTVLNIVGKTINELWLHFGSKPEDLVAAIGPCIGQKHYEVGREVLLYFEDEPFCSYNVIDHNGCNPGKGRLNLSQTIAAQLQGAGLKKENIEVANVCAFESKSDFYSARRDGAPTGRMINGIMLKL